MDLIRQLPREQQISLFIQLAEGSQSRRAVRIQYAEQQLRRLCTERGLDWDAMSEEQREAFIDDLVHEDRPCRQ
jgi:hypothetical protein